MTQTILVFLFLFHSPGESVIGGRTSPDGTEAIACDLPETEHMKNTGGSDGAGLCVFTSVEHSGRWQNETSTLGFQERMRSEPGGGYPGKLDRMMKKYCPQCRYLQYTGNDPSLLRSALRSGRMPAVTYGFSPRYNSRIAHMVNLVHFSDRWACVLDNNFPGSQKYEWMNPAEFQRRWVMGGGGWAVFLLSPPPPPIPCSFNSIRQKCRDGKCGPAPLIPPEEPSPAADEVIENFGIETQQLAHAEKCWLNGRSISIDEGRRILGDENLLPDDLNLLRLTVIGNPADRKQLLEDLQQHPALAEWKTRLVVQAYSPEHWAVRDAGFILEGSPRIILQAAPDETGRGRVLHSQGDYQDGAAGLAGALRKADPNYNGLRDADFRKVAGITVPAWADPWIMLAIALMGGLAGRFSMPLLGLAAQVLQRMFGKGRQPPNLDELLDSLLKRMDEKGRK